jgi:signal transduction histidine kinase/ligand-binding sensor domain-containing protein
MLPLLASVLLGSLAVDSAPRPLTQWVRTAWAAKDGAPTNIRALAQTRDGYLWIGTPSALVRFDGVRFVPFAPRGGDTASSAGVRRLLASRDGTLWIVWRTGSVSHLVDGRLKTYGVKDGLPSAYDLTESSKGLLIAGTAAGLSRFSDGAWKDAGHEWQYPGTESQAVWFDREDELWAQTQARVVYLPAGARRFVDVGMPLVRGPVRADFAQAKDGTIWMAEQGRSAHTLPRVGEQRVISEVQVGTWTLLIDRKGSLWVGSLGDGLRRVLDPARIRGKLVAQFGAEAEQLTSKDGLQADVILASLEDREGNIWFGTTRGLQRFREGPFAPVAIAGSVRPHFVYATRDTILWVGSYGLGGFLRMGPSAHEEVGVTLFMPTSAFQDRSGALWTLEGPKIERLQRRNFERLPSRWSESLTFEDIAVDDAGTAYLFEHGLGLVRLAGDSVVPLASLPPSAAASKLRIDRRGRIWISQQERVAVYDHGTFRIFDAAKGEAPRGANGVLVNRAGEVWVVSDAGLSKFDEQRGFRSLLERQGVAGRSIYSIAEDESGAWWLATLRGVVRLPPGEAERGLADSNYTLRYRSFDLRDGLPGGIAPIAVSAPLVTSAADGLIWVATDSGVASIDPRSLPRSDPPPVLIETVRIDGRELSPSEATTFPPGAGDLEVDYTAATLSVPERVHFRYRLDGVDTTWRDVETRRRAYYTGLGPGAYRFRVIASNGDGAWNETAAQWSFDVLPAWYQTLWWRTGLVALIGAIGAAAAVLVQRRRHLQAQAALKGQYEATLAERARIAQDLHDTLLQGFAGVTLQLKAAELALPEQPDIAAETISRVQRLARESLREARERVWDMHETVLGNDDLPAALEAIARERTTGTGIAVAVITSGERLRLPRPVTDAALRIGREAIANAIRHAQARRIEIAVGFDTSMLHLEVRDDGRGFTPEEADAARRRGHFGLSGIHERAARLGGRCDALPRPGGGTIVVLELPLTPSH